MNRRGFLKIAPAIVCSQGIFRGATKIWTPPPLDSVSWQYRTEEQIVEDLTEVMYGLADVNKLVDAVAIATSMPKNILLGRSHVIIDS